MSKQNSKTTTRKQDGKPPCQGNTANSTLSEEHSSASIPATSDGQRASVNRGDRRLRSSTRSQDNAIRATTSGYSAPPQAADFPTRSNEDAGSAALCVEQRKLNTCQPSADECKSAMLLLQTRLTNTAKEARCPLNSGLNDVRIHEEKSEDTASALQNQSDTGSINSETNDRRPDEYNFMAVSETAPRDECPYTSIFEVPLNQSAKEYEEHRNFRNQRRMEVDLLLGSLGLLNNEDDFCAQDVTTAAEEQLGRYGITEVSFVPNGDGCTIEAQGVCRNYLG